MVKATAVYTRYSSHAQDGGVSTDLQIMACRKLVGDGPVVEYHDKAKTGRAVAGRVELMRLLADAEAGKLSAIVVYKYDRIGRNLAETSTIIAQLEDSGVEVLSATEGKEQLTRGIHLVISEHYSQVLAERTRDGLAERFRQRAWTGGPPPTGYAIATGADGVPRLVLNPDEEKIVNFLFATYATRSVGFKKLAAMANERGFLTRRGNLWCHTSVKVLLGNPIYGGLVQWNRRRFKLNKKTGRRVPVWKSDSEVQEYHDDSLAFVPPEILERVRTKLAQQAKPSRRRATPTFRPLTGLVQCAQCGRAVYTRKSKNRKGEYHYLVCGTPARIGHDACDNHAHLREDGLLLKITGTLMGMVTDTDATIRSALTQARQLLSDNREEAAAIRAQLPALDASIGKLTALLTDTALDAMAKNSVIRQLSEAEGERERLNQAMANLADRANDDLAAVEREIRRSLDDARRSLADVTTPEQLHQVIERYVGPMLLNADATVSRALETPSAPDVVDAGADSKRCIAGGGFEPPTSGL